MKRWLIRWTIGIGLLVGVFFLIRTQILYLDYFDGTILEKIEETMPTVIDRRTQKMSEYFFRVETDDGRELVVPVEQLLYFRSRKGMQITKGPFSVDLHLVDSSAN